MPKKKLRILIDGDSCVYKAGFAAQAAQPDNTPVELSIRCLHNVLKKQLKYIKKYIYPGLKVKEAIDRGNLKVYLTSNDRSNFRFKVATIQEYKGNRKDKQKPNNYDAIRQHLIDEWKAEVISGMEADDKLSIEAHKDPENTLVVHDDKDLRQVPGLHLEMNLTRRPYFVDLQYPGFLHLEKTTNGKWYLFATGQMSLYTQMLQGDISDNIPGVSGYGPRKIYTTLTSTEYCPVMHINKIYKETFGAEEGIKRMQEVASLLSLLREEPNDQEIKV